MKLHYWGTAAAEGIPALFCRCDTCLEARRRGGKNIRTRSQALVDDRLLMDFPADTYAHCLTYGFDLSGISHCLITHSHSDHLYPADFEMRRPGFYSHLGELPALEVYGSAGAMEYAGKEGDAHGDHVGNSVFFHALEPFCRQKVGDYTVIPLPARHDASSHPFFYWIEDKQGKALLYGNDTGFFLDEVWAFLEKETLHMDFVSLDCTAGDVPVMGYDSHMNLNDNIRVKDRLTEMGCATAATRFCCTHFSHNGEAVLFEEFSRRAAEAGFLTAYDGLTVEF